MSESSQDNPNVEVLQEPAELQTEGELKENAESVEHPAKVMRIASMARQLLEEVRQAPLDEASRARMAEIYETSIKELGEVLSPELRDELHRLSSPFVSDTPSDAELRIAHAQLVGWLEGLFHGIQAMLFAQQMENRARLEELHRQSLPPGPRRPDGSPLEHPPGQYL
jgi:Protein of unknown function (DUF2587)